MNLNYTLTILPQRLSYYHHIFVSAKLDNACEYVLRSGLLFTFSYLEDAFIQCDLEVGLRGRIKAYNVKCAKLEVV